jgi:hypothetical protein
MLHTMERKFIQLVINCYKMDLKTYFRLETINYLYWVHYWFMIQGSLLNSTFGRNSIRYPHVLSLWSSIICMLGSVKKVVGRNGSITILYIGQFIA